MPAHRFGRIQLPPRGSWSRNRSRNPAGAPPLPRGPACPRRNTLPAAGSPGPIKRNRPARSMHFELIFAILPKGMKRKLTAYLLAYRRNFFGIAVGFLLALILQFWLRDNYEAAMFRSLATIVRKQDPA